MNIEAIKTSGELLNFIANVGLGLRILQGVDHSNDDQIREASKQIGMFLENIEPIASSIYHTEKDQRDLIKSIDHTIIWWTDFREGYDRASKLCGQNIWSVDEGIAILNRLKLAVSK